MKTLLFALVLATASCNTSTTMASDWKIEVTTDGGFTGRGVGAVTIDGDSVDAQTCKGTLSASEKATVARDVKNAAPAKWKSEYGQPFADGIRYTLTLNGARASWYGEDADLPKDLHALFDTAWKIRARVSAECSK